MEERPAARVKIELPGGTFELEGSEDFLNAYADTIEGLTELLKQPAPGADGAERKESDQSPGKQFTIFEPEAAASDHTPSPNAPPPPPPLASPDSFGELYYKVPKSTSKTDIVLLASYFVQSHNGEGTFTTREVNKLLRDHGIDLTNPAHFNKLNQDYKKVFKMRQGQYKVSEEGVEHLRGILR